jgi:predicted permease
MTVIATLGLGIGANAAMFSVIDRIMFRPYPHLHDPGSVHRVYLQTSNSERRFTNTVMPYARFLDLQRRTQSFSQYAVVSEWRLAVGEGVETRVRKVAGVSASLFPLFGVQPASGRFFGPAEDVTPMGSLVAVMGHGHWTTEFGGQPVEGRVIRLGPAYYTIIGVAPEQFVGTVTGGAPDFFVPITTIPAAIQPSSQRDYTTAFNWDWVEVLVRRRDAVSVEAATADLTNGYRQSRAAQREQNPRVLPDSIAHPVAIAGPARGAAGPDSGPELRILMWTWGVAVIVLLIACANVTNLMLSRVVSRRREIAVRLALGVSRARLTAQFVLEGLVLAGIGIGVGLLVAQWGGVAIRAMLLPEGSEYNLATDWRTMGVAAACALLAVVLTTAAPAWMATRSNLVADLKAGMREGAYRRSRLRTGLLVMQGSLSVLLLVGAGLFVRSLREVLEIPLGFDARPVIEVITDLRGLPMDEATTVATRARLLEAARQIPGVEAATLVNSRLFRTNTTTLRVPGIDSVERLGRFNVQVTTGDYFQVMRTRILRGTSLTSGASPASPPEVVVSAAMARALWPDRAALGQCIQVLHWNAGPDSPAPPCTTVVGIAEDVAQQGGIRDEVRFMYYLNAEQLGGDYGATILVRMREDNAAASIDRVRRGMQAAMPGDGFVVVGLLQDAVDNQVRSWRLGATLFLAFGGLALAVAAIGLYGVVGYTVAQRQHELAMRSALGAHGHHLTGLVMAQGLGPAAAGVAIGLAFAAASAPQLGPLLYGTSPHDPLVLGGVSALMLLVAVVACAGPAYRAMRVDPNRVLRSE